ncbi:CvpA family protein [Buchnera aphidicola]|uniref:CvpA family protein n=1 Tax=Buchnera aphidicola TaxID=9 RepID=UPI003D18AD6A
MILIDSCIFIIILFSTVLGMFKGFFKELISTIFWFFFIYFFIHYKYFSFFYSDIFLQNKNYLIILIIIIFFFIIKILLNFIFNKIIKQFKLLYINIIFGGVFGFARGIILVFFILFAISKYNNSICLDLLEKSFFIHLFFNIFNNNFKYFSED